jgi:hypothetical protein
MMIYRTIGLAHMVIGPTSLWTNVGSIPERGNQKEMDAEVNWTLIQRKAIQMK